MIQQPFSFRSLDPDMIIDGLLAHHVQVASGLTALNSYENRVYQFRDEEGRRLVVKFYRPQRWSDAQIKEEHQFAIELQRQQIPLAAPLAIDGETLLHHQGFRFAVYLSVGGRQYQADNLEQLEQVGQYLGRIHKAGRQRLFTDRPSMDTEEYLHVPRQVLAQSPLIPENLRTELLRVSDLLIGEVVALWYKDFQPLRLHGDCHAANILWHDGPWFVDLDDARNGPAVQDFWMLLHGDDTEQRVQLATLIEAYEQFCPFNVAEIALIEPLRAMRLLYYLAWLICRWSDPAFPRNFPWLNDEDYWQQQIATFIAQRKALHKPPLQLTPMY